MGTITLRAARARELSYLSDLCLRSKAIWGYDAAFMAACVDELTLQPEELDHTAVIVAERDQAVLGVAQVSTEAGSANLTKLFVDPEHIGKGVGVVLFDWAVQAARDLRADKLVIEADPGAEPFYLKRGAKRVGEVPSGSIPGRILPLLQLPL